MSGWSIVSSTSTALAVVTGGGALVRGCERLRSLVMEVGLVGCVCSEVFNAGGLKGVAGIPACENRN